MGAPGKLYLPWTQIKHLQLYKSFSEVALQTISLCAEVEHLTLSNVDDADDNEEDFNGHIASDKVKSLTIECAEGQCDVDDVLRHLTFSKMSSFAICGELAFPDHEAWPTWDGTHLEGFILRSSCTLTTLKLSAVPMTDTQALSLLQSLPTIDSLETEEYLCHDENRIITKRFFGRPCFSNLRPADPVLPRLSNMELRIHAKNIDPEGLLQVLSYRWLLDAVQVAEVAEVGVQCLRFVTIVVLTNAQTPQDQNALDCLQCFKKVGMNLKVVYGNAFELYPHLKKDIKLSSSILLATSFDMFIINLLIIRCSF
ncbi:hypothetical protein L218DRAFT_565932 [Marasmius fiardii PR-910]|nr:hypothetical protein L218DRAFT_565932 [Marasmius fiardii PR-910]